LLQVRKGKRSEEKKHKFTDVALRWGLDSRKCTFHHHCVFPFKSKTICFLNNWFSERS